jgi:DNA-binding NarL/FixJ family response regulator
MIRVLLAEDQTLVREGLDKLLSLTPDITVVSRAIDGQDALEKLRASPPDVLLLDVRMPKMTGLDVLRALRAAGDTTPAILLTTFDDDAALLNGIRLGAKGYLLKDVSLATLTDAIRLVAAGGTMISPVVTERLRRGLKMAAPPAPRETSREAGPDDSSEDSLQRSAVDPLSARETQVLRLMTGGYSNREIASALDLSDGTVKNHVSSILSKLDARDRTRAVLKAIEKGYV